MFTDKDFLGVEGKKLVNTKGETVILKGTNLGGWLHREGWMDGGGACLAPLTVFQEKKETDSIVLELEKVCRCNRIAVTGKVTGDFIIEASSDNVSWKTVAQGNFCQQKNSRRDNLKPAPYVPGVNVYDEGVFVCKDVIHTNEFFARFIRISGKNLESAIPYRYGDIDDYSARNILLKRFGAEKAEELLSKYQECYITRKDLEYIKSKNFNFVRVPVYWQEIMDENCKIKEHGWDNIDWLLEQCRELELYVMLDYHGAPGGNTLGSITAGQLDSNRLWHEPLYQKMSMKIWKNMAERYKDHPEIAVYDLLNEPCVIPVESEREGMTGVIPPSTPTMFYQLSDWYKTPVRKFYQEAYKIIRETGDRHVLCMQQFADIQLLEAPAVYGWENVMYQVHCYPVGDWRNHDQVLDSMKAYMELLEAHIPCWKIPVLAGEFCIWEFEDVWELWMQWLTDHGVHWANWSYKITDPAEKDHWSLFYDHNGTYVDYYRDSCEMIEHKWKNYETVHYRKNQGLETLLKKYI